MRRKAVSACPSFFLSIVIQKKELIRIRIRRGKKKKREKNI